MRTLLLLSLLATTCFAQPSKFGFGQNPSLQYGLVGWWTFNEGSGTTACDWSGNGNNGTLSGTTLPVWTNGVVGGGMYFTNGKVVLPPYAAQIVTNAFSFCSWICTTQAQYSTILGYYDAYLSSGVLWGLASDGKLHVEWGTANDGNNIYGSLGAKVNTGNWLHYCLTYTNLQAKCYVNGALSASKTITTNWVVLANKTIQIGTPVASNEPFIGSMDDFRIYNRALSATEVQQLYWQTASQWKQGP